MRGRCASASASAAQDWTSGTSCPPPPFRSQWQGSPASITSVSAPISTLTSTRTRLCGPGASLGAADAGLLDTSVAVEIGTIPLARLPLVSAISCLTLAELEAGPGAAGDAFERRRRRRHLRLLRAQLTTIPFDPGCAGAYGSVHAAVAAAGRKPRGRRAVDLLVAATAVAHRLPLYTRNPDDLAGLDGLLEVVVVP